MTEILFVNPPVPAPKEHSAYGVMAPPLGILYCCATLRQAGFEVAAIDLQLSRDPVADLKNALERHDPRIVGFYALTQGYYAAEYYHHLTRSLNPDVITWTGGPHVSYEYEHALKVSGFDVVFRFEAEYSVVEVAKAQLRNSGRLQDVSGIVFLDGEEVVMTAARAREKNLDEYPYPARDLAPIHEYTRPGTVMSSRGCPLKCIFCIASTFEDAYRYRTPENVVGELREMYENWGINDFYFVDNVFTTHRQRARQISRLIRESGLPIGWYCVSRVDYVSQVLMQDLASAGCYRIECGVESAHADVIDTMKKRIKIEQVLNAADVILGLGMQPMFTFQVGHPDDTPASIEMTLKMIETLRDRGAGTYLSVTTPYPGTPLFVDRGSKYKFKWETDSWEDFRMSNPTYSTANFTTNDIRQAIFREARSLRAALAQGKVRDPAAAPWIRFAPGAEKVILPDPPKEDDKAPLRTSKQTLTLDTATKGKRTTLPVLQVNR